MGKISCKSVAEICDYCEDLVGQIRSNEISLMGHLAEYHLQQTFARQQHSFEAEVN